MTDCIECDECFYWLHFDYTTLSSHDLDILCNSSKDYFCSICCLMRQLPYHSFSGTLDITEFQNSNNQNLLSTSSVGVDSSAEKISNDLNCDDLSSSVSNSDTTAPSSIASTSIQPTSPTISFNNNMHSKSSKFKYNRQFLDINCSYLCPNDLEDSFLANENSEFVIYHNNVRSFKKNMQGKMNKTLEIFQNCSSKLPDILTFSDTQVNENSLIPPLDGYHDFEFTPTPTGAGGVGFFLRNTLDYVLCPDLKLNLNLCEDIWLKIKNVKNSEFDNKGLIIGVIYRHGQSYTQFCEKLCERLLSLNEKKREIYPSW